MRIQGLDHLVLTVTDMQRTLAFYTGDQVMTEIEARWILAFGSACGATVMPAEVDEFLFRHGAGKVVALEHLAAMAV